MNTPFSFEKNPIEATKSKQLLDVYGQKKATKDPQWELVEQYLPLLKSIVGRMRIFFPTHMDIRDIYSIALGGLISASQMYDPQKGSVFGNYAKVRIRGSLMDELRKMDWLSRNDRTDVKKYRKELDSLELKLKREPSDQEVCQHLNIDIYEHARLKRLNKPLQLISLDNHDVHGYEDNISFHDVIPDLNALDARDISEEKDIQFMLRQGIESLPDMSKKVLVLYYIEGLKLSEIAEVLELSESRVCQIHGKAIDQLRQFMVNKN